MLKDYLPNKMLDIVVTSLPICSFRKSVPVMNGFVRADPQPFWRLYALLLGLVIIVPRSHWLVVMWANSCARKAAH